LKLPLEEGQQAFDRMTHAPGSALKMVLGVAKLVLGFGEVQPKLLVGIGIGTRCWEGYGVLLFVSIPPSTEES